MAKRYSSDSVADILGEMIFAGAAVVGVAAVATGVTIAHLFHTPTEEKLRRLTPQEGWGDPIAATFCSSCGTIIEHEAQYCYGCGEIRCDGLD
jgi:hypothetical protein